MSTFVPSNRGVEQLAARWAHNPKVRGSLLSKDDSHCGVVFLFCVSRFVAGDVSTTVGVRVSYIAVEGNSSNGRSVLSWHRLHFPSLFRIFVALFLCFNI